MGGYIFRQLLPTCWGGRIYKAGDWVLPCVFLSEEQPSSCVSGTTCQGEGQRKREGEGPAPSWGYCQERFSRILRWGTA